jgi:hypothetical protein
MSICDGTGNDGSHCCYIDGETCPFVAENIAPDRQWACSLRVEHGNWADVHTDPRYLAVVKPVWESKGMMDCGDWRGPLRTGVGNLQCCFAREGD